MCRKTFVETRVYKPGVGVGILILIDQFLCLVFLLCIQIHFDPSLRVPSKSSYSA